MSKRIGVSTHTRNNWLRGTCQYGIMPANGLVYVPSHSCGCYPESKLWGFWALAAARPTVTDEKRQRPDGQRLLAAARLHHPSPSLEPPFQRNFGLQWNCFLGPKLRLIQNLAVPKGHPNFAHSMNKTSLNSLLRK